MRGNYQVSLGRWVFPQSKSRSTPSKVDLSGHPTFELIAKLALLKEGKLPKEQNTVL